MALKDFIRKQENFIGTCFLLLVIMIITAVRYDYYFDLNDDVLMKDILAGVYTGEPEGHNIQMLWLVSGFVSLLYRIAGGLPWYGLFLCTCHYCSLGLIVHRSLTFCEKLSGKALLLFTEGVLIVGLFLPHLVSAQYTITCTLLVAAATFLFITTDAKLPAKEFIRKNILSVLLVFLAYLIRSEMCLLVFPLVCVAGVIKWGSENVIFTKENLVKYLTVIGGILAGILIGQGSHMLAYGSGQWRAFTEYFDNRTELYDFQTIPEYAEHQAFYESIDMTESERDLLENYNFGLDEKIDEKLVGKVAAYAAANRKQEKPFGESLKAAMGNYVRRTLYGPSHNESDYPWNVVILFSYLAVFTTAMISKEAKLLPRLLQIVWKLGFLGCARSVLWLWLIMRERVPVRISHSMYLMELCILLGMLMLQCQDLRKSSDGQKPERHAKINLSFSIGILYALLGVLFIGHSVAVTDADVLQKAENNVRYNKLYRYLEQEENQNNFYFMDVYSSVLYTEKMFADVDNTINNYDIMGGWACKSPLYRKKLAAFGMTTMEEGLVSMENVYYVQEAGADTKWLTDYYEDQEKPVTLTAVEMPVEEFELYRVESIH